MQCSSCNCLIWWHHFMLLISLKHHYSFLTVFIPSLRSIFLPPPLNPANRCHALTLHYKPKGGQGFVQSTIFSFFFFLSNYWDTNVNPDTVEESNTLQCNCLGHYNWVNLRGKKKKNWLCFESCLSNYYYLSMLHAELILKWKKIPTEIY